MLNLLITNSAERGIREFAKHIPAKNVEIEIKDYTEVNGSKIAYFDRIIISGSPKIDAQNIINHIFNGLKTPKCLY